MTKHPTLINNGKIVTPSNAYDDIEANVIGHGKYVVSAGATLDFLYGVGGGQTIKLSNKHPGGVYGASSLAINDPADFHGQVDLRYKVAPPGAPAAEQPNIGLLMVGQGVDSYSFKGDMLKLWLGNKVVETLNLTVRDSYGITVQAAPGAWIFVSANTPTQHGIDFLGGMHTPAMPVRNA